MFGRKKDPEVLEATSTQDSVGSHGETVGKGHATPTRREAEAKNRRPLVQNDPKTARAVQRQRNAEARAKMNEAMVTGEEKYLPAQHRGPQRRFIRDYVDARWSIGEFFLPIALVFVVLTFLVGQRPEWALPLLLGLYGIVGLAIADAVIMGRRVRKRLREKYGEAHLQKGGVMYAVLRAFQMRPTRMPKPQVKRGEFPA